MAVTGIWVVVISNRILRCAHLLMFRVTDVGMNSALCLLVGRAHAEANSSVKHEEELRKDDALKDVASEVDSDSAVESSSSSGEEEEEGSSEGKKKKQRIGFRDRKVIDIVSTSMSPRHLSQ